jgi:hypothetical protein
MYATNKSLVRQLAARTTPAGLRLAADIGGLACLCAAAWAWDWRAGLAGLGIVLLLLAARGDA